MQDVVTLMQEAEKKLTEYDPVFVYKTETFSVLYTIQYSYIKQRRS